MNNLNQVQIETRMYPSTSWHSLSPTLGMGQELKHWNSYPISLPLSKRTIAKYPSLGFPIIDFTSDIIPNSFGIEIGRGLKYWNTTTIITHNPKRYVPTNIHETVPSSLEYQFLNGFIFSSPSSYESEGVVDSFVLTEQDKVKQSPSHNEDISLESFPCNGYGRVVYKCFGGEEDEF